MGETRRFGFIAGRAVVGGRAAVMPVAEVRAAAGGAVAAVRIVGVVFADATGRAELESVAELDIVDSVSRLKARSRADWNRCSRSFSRQRRTRRSTGGGSEGSSSRRSGGSSFRIALSVSIDELRLNARVPVSIS